MGKASKRWTDADRAFLSANYNLKGADYCASHLGRSKVAVRRAATRFEVARKVGPRSKVWSDKDDLLLRSLCNDPTLLVDDIAKSLCRSPAAINTRMSKLGLVRCGRNQRHRKLTADQRNEVVRLYSEKGLSARSIKETLGLTVCLDSIYAVLKEGDVSRDNTGSRNKVRTDAEEQIIEDLYLKKEESTLKISQMVGGSVSGINLVLQRRGVKLRKAAFGGYRLYRFTDKIGREFTMRSKWETLAAHHLDESCKTWNYEERSYTLSVLDKRGNPCVYTPDFWIYDESGNLQFVVDVKGRRTKAQDRRIDSFIKDYPDIHLQLWDEPYLRAIGFTWKDLRDPKIKLGENFAEVTYSSD